MTTTYFIAWLRAFIFTELVEMPIYRFGFGAPWRMAFAASALTHPVVWFGFFGPFSERLPIGYETRAVVAEVFAWLVEAVFLSRVVRRPDALGWSFVANAASVLLGTILRSRYGYP